jgi:hypothetical protein
MGRFVKYKFFNTQFKLSPTLAQLVANSALWSIFCCIVLANRWITGESSPLRPLTTSDREALTHFIDERFVCYFAIAFVVVFFLVAFMNHRSSTKEREPNMKLLLNAVTTETASAFLNLGSLLVAIAYFLSQPLYLLCGLAAWALWFFLIPPRSADA